MLRGGYPRDEAASYVGVSVPTFERCVRKKTMPPPRKVSDGRVVWLRSELDEALAKLPVSDLPPGPARSSR